MWTKEADHSHIFSRGLANRYFEHRMEDLDGMSEPATSPCSTNADGSLQIFGTMNACACICALFLPETKGKTLEEMDVLFGIVPEDIRREDIEAKLEHELKTGVKEPTVRSDDKGTSPI